MESHVLVLWMVFNEIGYTHFRNKVCTSQHAKVFD
jgi:hypothetical protein